MENNTHARTLALLLGGLALVGVTGAVLSTSETDRAPRAAQDSAGFARIAVSSSEGEEAQGPCTWSAGHRMAYDVRTQTHTTMDMGPLMERVELGGSSPMQTQATAVDMQASRRWHVDLHAVAQATDGSTVLAAHIEAEPTEVQGSVVQPPIAGLSETFLVRVDPRCSIREFGWRTEGDLEAARDQQQLLAGLGYLAPAAGQDGYGGVVFDVAGRYLARYVVEDDGRLSGQAVSYSEPFGRGTGPRSMQPSLAIDESSITITPQAGQWFDALDNVRTVGLSIFDEPIGSLKSAISARRGEPTPWRPSVDLDDGGWTWGLLLGAPSSSEDDTKTAAGSKLAGVAVADAVAGYLAIIHERGSSVDALPHLVEWLRANPEGAAELLAMLRAGAFDDERSGSAGLFLALATAGTPQATGALLDILHGHGDALDHKISAAHALSSVEAPTEAMIDAVVALAQSDALDPIARGSMAMSLGSFASRNAERAPQLAERARGHIEQWLESPKDDADLAGSLLAAGNAGHDSLAPALDPYFEHDDPQIRERAAHAVRHMSPQEAFPRLSEGMLDASEAVRASAAETAVAVSRERGAPVPEALVDTAIERLDLQTPAREQKALMGLLGEAAKHGSDGAKAVLEQHFADELGRGDRDLEKLRALGRHTNTRWTAP